MFPITQSKKMDRTTHRYVAQQLLHEVGCDFAHTSHTLHHIANRHKDGLSEKEHAYLVALQKSTEDHMRKVQRIRERLESR